MFTSPLAPSKGSLTTSVLLFSSLLCLAGTPHAARAQAPAPATQGKTVSLDVVNADFPSVMWLLNKETRVDFSIRKDDEPGDQPYKRVTVHLQNASLGDTVRAVAMSAGAQIREDGSFGYDFKPFSNIPARPQQLEITPAPKQISFLNPADLHWQKLTLQHVIPSEILKLMHWNAEKTAKPAPRNPNLPDGVQAIYALQSDNSLLIQATPDGFTSVKAVVKTLDIEPRRIQVQWQMIDVPESDWKKLEGIGDKDKLLAALAPGNYKTISGPTVTTTDGVQATVKVETKVPYGPKQDFLTVGQSTTVTPRVNTDGTITVQVTATDLEVAGPPAEANGAPPTTTQSISTIRTAKSGETIILSGLSQKTPTGDILRLILVTPKIIP